MLSYVDTLRLKLRNDPGFAIDYLNIAINDQEDGFSQEVFELALSDVLAAYSS